MITLKEAITEANKKGSALGHFNISGIDALWAIFHAGRKLNVPVIIGLSEGEADFVGIKQAAALVKSIREEFDAPVFINSDHTHSLERAIEAAEAGFDSITFDRSELSLADNIKETKACVEYMRKNHPNILIEGELGFIGNSSEVLVDIPTSVKLDESHLTKPEDAKKFVTETGVDLLAPAVGNMHGMLKGGIDPAINVTRVKEIGEACGVPLVLHGGSGNTEDDYKGSIKAGVAIVHVNTELRLAWKRGLVKALAENQDEVAPYKLLRGSVQEMQKVVEKKLISFQ